MVLKTPDGRLDCILLPRPGSIEFRLFRDRTQRDRLLSAQTVMQEIIDHSKARTDKEKNRRKENKPADGRKKRKAPRTPLPTGIPNLIPVLEDDDSSDEDDDADGPVLWAGTVDSAKPSR
eukprot:GHVS01051029.1.p2 GENE.GHVS01051029.1~~GHVS01051029.1.p2  ORF type:complete len:120 (-),score=10.19 GHVS01051029.1:16-375(-)